MEELLKIKFKQLPLVVQIVTIWVMGQLILYSLGIIYILYLIGSGQV